MPLSNVIQSAFIAWSIAVEHVFHENWEYCVLLVCSFFFIRNRIGRMEKEYLNDKPTKMTSIRAISWSGSFGMNKLNAFFVLLERVCARAHSHTHLFPVIWKRCDCCVDFFFGLLFVFTIVLAFIWIQLIHLRPVFTIQRYLNNDDEWRIFRFVIVSQLNGRAPQCWCCAVVGGFDFFFFRGSNHLLLEIINVP